MTASKESVKYGDKCYEVERNDFTLHRMLAYAGLIFLVNGAGVYALLDMRVPGIVLMALSILLFIVYFFMVYKRHAKIKNSLVIECKDSFRRYSIW